MSNVAQKHVAVFAFPFGSHAALLLSLIRRLATSAPHTIFSFFSTSHSNSSLFKDNNSNVNVKPYNVDDGLLSDGFAVELRLPELVEMFMKVTPGNYVRALEVAEKEVGAKVCCILSDAFLWFSADIAEQRGVPWVALYLAAARSLLVHVETDLIREKLGLNGSGDDSLDFIHDFSTIRAADLQEGVVFGDIESGFHRMLHKMGLTLPRATTIVINSYENLDPPIENQLKSKFKNRVMVGPYALVAPHKPNSDKHGCLAWLDQKKPASVAYICFGSVMTPPPHELAAVAEALEECNIPFLWSFRGNPDEVLPKGFVERTTSKNLGKMVPWAPQLEILQHDSVGVFVNHSGWNSVLESIIEGVPLICRPYFGDHNLNMRCVEAIWGIGVGFEAFTKSGVVKALKLILSSKEGQTIRENIRVYRDIASKAVQPFGDSSNNFRTLVELISG